MSKLYARAKVKLENALYDYSKISMDDAYRDDCCFNLQQAIEMSLKYLVELNDRKYVPNHDIKAQLDILDELQVTFPGKELIRSMTSTLNEWESESMKKDKFLATIQDVEQAINIAQGLVTYLGGL